MVEKSIREEHKEEYAKYLLAEFRNGKEASLTDDEKLELEILKEGIKEEKEIVDEKETDDEILEKEILEEDDLEKLLEEDALMEKAIRSNRLNSFLMNQNYDAALSDTGIQSIMNLEEELEEIPLEEKEEGPDFSYKRLGEAEEDPYKNVVTKYESGGRDPQGPPSLRDTPEQRLEQQSKMYNQDAPNKDKDNPNIIEFRQPKETGYDNLSSKARRGIY